MLPRRKKPIKISSSTKISSVSSWSLALNAFFYSIVIGIVWNVVVAGAWQALDRSGAFLKMDEIFVKLAGDDAATLSSYVAFEKVMSVSLVLSVSFIASIPLFALISGVIYNAISRITGGVRVTMTSKVFRTLEEDLAAHDAKVAEKEALLKAKEEKKQHKGRGKRAKGMPVEVVTEAPTAPESPTIPTNAIIEPPLLNEEPLPAVLPGELTVEEQERLNKLLSQ